MKKIIIKGIIYLLVLGAGIWIGNQGIKLIWGKVDLNTDLSSLENKNVSLDDISGIYISDTSQNSKSSEISFEIEENVQGTTIGKFNKFNIQLNAHEDFTQSEITVSIDVASIDTKSSMRDEHLLAEDYFNSDKYPKINFTSNAINNLPCNDTIDYISTGKLSMLGVEKYLDIQFNLEGTGENKAGKEIAIFKGVFLFDRTQFGMQKDESLANVVKVNFITELIKQ